MLLHLQPFNNSHLHIIVGLQSLKCCISRQNKYLPKGVILQHTLQLYTVHMWSFSTYCNCMQRTCDPLAHIATVHSAHCSCTQHTWSFSTHCSCTQHTCDPSATWQLYTVHVRHKSCSSCVFGNYEPSTLLFGLQKQHLGGHLCYGNKWKWLFVNGCVCKSFFSTNVMECLCLNMFLDWTVFWGFCWKVMTLEWS
jgi:hypothetical protein